MSSQCSQWDGRAGGNRLYLAREAAAAPLRVSSAIALGRECQALGTAGQGIVRVPDSLLPAQSSQPLGGARKWGRTSSSATLGQAELLTAKPRRRQWLARGHIAHMGSNPTPHWAPTPLVSLSSPRCLWDVLEFPLAALWTCCAQPGPHLSHGHGAAGICTLGCPME